MLVPLNDELLNLGAQVRLGSEVCNAESFSLQDAKPLLDLIHPGTVNGRKVELKPGMIFQPILHLFARMYPQVVADNVDVADARANLLFHMRKECNEFRLTLSIKTESIYPSSTGIKCGKQLQRPRAGIFVFDERRLVSRLRRLCRMGARPWLQRCLFVHAQHDFIFGQRTCVPIDYVIDPSIEFGVPWMFGRKPHVMTPRFQLAQFENSADGLGRDRIRQPIGNYLARQFCAIPLRQRTAHDVRPLASEFGYMRRHSWLGKKASGRAPACPPNHRCVLAGTDRAIYTRSDM